MRTPIMIPVKCYFNAWQGTLSISATGKTHVYCFCCFDGGYMGDFKQISHVSKIKTTKTMRMGWNCSTNCYCVALRNHLKGSPHSLYCILLFCVRESRLSACKNLKSVPVSLLWSLQLQFNSNINYTNGINNSYKPLFERKK